MIRRRDPTSRLSRPELCLDCDDCLQSSVQTDGDACLCRCQQIVTTFPYGFDQSAVDCSTRVFISGQGMGNLCDRPAVRCFWTQNIIYRGFCVYIRRGVVAWIRSILELILVPRHQGSSVQALVCRACYYPRPYSGGRWPSCFCENDLCMFLPLPLPWAVIIALSLAAACFPLHCFNDLCRPGYARLPETLPQANAAPCMNVFCAP